MKLPTNFLTLFNFYNCLPHVHAVFLLTIKSKYSSGPSYLLYASPNHTKSGCVKTCPVFVYFFLTLSALKYLMD